MSTFETTYRHRTSDNLDSHWDTPYGQFVFKANTSAWPKMVVDSGGGYQKKLLSALIDIQEMMLMETGKSSVITIS